MPFDGFGFAFYNRVSKMDQVISLLDTRDKWCKGNLKTPDGRYCIRGAIKAVEGAAVLESIVLRAIHEATGQRFMRIESFNDHPYTRHAQVLRVLAHARHLLTSRKSNEESAVQASALVRLQAWVKGLSPVNYAPRVPRTGSLRFWAGVGERE